jgi:hypothetical protein
MDSLRLKPDPRMGGSPPGTALAIRHDILPQDAREPTRFGEGGTGKAGKS